MRISRIGIVGAVVAAMVASGAGIAVASASTARPAVSGTEHFSLMTTQPSASKYVMIASGVFTAGGTDINGNTVDQVKLPNGGFKINHGTKFHIVKEQFNSRTCLALVIVTANFTLEGGTGAYKGVSGSGKALITDTAIARRTKAGCDMNANPVVNEETISATAHVKL
jgi:hypothetical protein